MIALGNKHHIIVSGCNRFIQPRVRSIDALNRITLRTIDFVKDIQPLFEAACIKCHAKGKEKGGFSLETRELFLKGGETDKAAIVGDSAHSYIVELVASTDSTTVMPKPSLLVA